MELRLINIIRFCLIGVIAFNISSCKEESSSEPKKPKATKPKKELVKTPEFSADSAFYFTKKQVEFGPRVPNSIAHKECADWLVRKLKNYGGEVIVQKGKKVAHDKKTLSYSNIISRFNINAEKRILLSAHWDTRPWADNGTVAVDDPIDGANDGASGVAVLLEIARVMKIESPKVGIDIILFDIEDYGKGSFHNSFCYGSQEWLKKGGINPKPSFGINLDMVGDPNATFLYEGHSSNYARFVLDKVWAAAHRLNYQSTFKTDYHSEITDDHYYVNLAGIPCIDIIDLRKNQGTFPRTWHTHDDNIDNISPVTLEKVGKTLLQVIYGEQ